MSCLEQALSGTLQENISFLSKNTSLSSHSDIVEMASRFVMEEVGRHLNTLVVKAKQGKGQA